MFTDQKNIEQDEIVGIWVVYKNRDPEFVPNEVTQMKVKRELKTFDWIITLLLMAIQKHNKIKDNPDRCESVTRTYNGFPL